MAEDCSLKKMKYFEAQAALYKAMAEFEKARREKAAADQAFAAAYAALQAAEKTGNKELIHKSKEAYKKAYNLMFDLGSIYDDKLAKQKMFRKEAYQARDTYCKCVPENRGQRQVASIPRSTFSQLARSMRIAGESDDAQARLDEVEQEIAQVLVDLIAFEQADAAA